MSDSSRYLVEARGISKRFADVEVLHQANLVVLSGLGGGSTAMLDAYDYLLEDQAVIEIGKVRLHTIKTPGHTPGSICFRVEGSPILFSGDTLFPGGAGGTDFEGGDFDTVTTCR